MEKSLECRNSELGEFGFKKNNSTGNFRKHGLERVIKPLPVRPFATFKDIIDNVERVHIHLRSSTPTIEGYPSDYCVVFYFGTLGYPNMKHFRLGQHKLTSALVNCNTEFSNISEESDNLNEAMFIGVINVSQQGQTKTPCLVWLQALDSCPLNVSQPIDVLGGFTLEESFVIPDGEFDVPGKHRTLEKPKLPEQVVKHRPQVVADIAKEQRSVGVKLFPLLKPDDALSLIAVTYETSDESIRLALKSPFNQVIEGFKVTLCSAEFEKRAIERVHMLQYPQGEDYGQKDAKNSEGTRNTRAHYQQ